MPSIFLFNQFYKDNCSEVHNLPTDTIRLGLITKFITPTIDDDTPAWGATSGIDYDANEVTPGGNYPSGGPAFTTPSLVVSNVTDNVTFSLDNLTIAVDVANPKNARWGIFYNATAPDKQAIGFLDLGADVDLSAANFTITWSSVFQAGV